MRVFHAWKRTAAAISLQVVAGAGLVYGATFPIGGLQNGFSNVPSAQRTQGEFTLTIEPGPPGALLNGLDPRGAGVNSSGLGGVIDPGSAKFDLLEGSAAGNGEFVRLSFDRPGLLTGINFDGVKDEALEYFILDTPHGGRINFFDSQININVPGAVAAAVQANVVTGAVVLLLENLSFDDEAQGLHIPFAAGEQFTLTYAELGPVFHPTDTPNGARLQGITVVAVPEPATHAISLGVSILLGWFRGCGSAGRRGK